MAGQGTLVMVGSANWGARQSFVGSRAGAARVNDYVPVPSWAETPESVNQGKKSEKICCTET